MITLEKAQKAIEAGQAKAKELKTAVTIAIVDDHGVLVALARMDGALNVSPGFAKAKATTSAAFGLPSGDIAGFAQEGKPYFGINTAFGGKFMVIAGGIPVKTGEKLIGAVGVGGSMDVAQDEQCAKAAAAALSQDFLDAGN